MATFVIEREGSPVMTLMTEEEEGGSFRELRERYLPLFESAGHLNDRRGKRSPAIADEADLPLSVEAEKPARRPWKISGIFHFAHHDDD